MWVRPPNRNVGPQALRTKRLRPTWPDNGVTPYPGYISEQLSRTPRTALAARGFRTPPVITAATSAFLPASTAVSLATWRQAPAGKSRVRSPLLFYTPPEFRTALTARPWWPKTTTKVRQPTVLGYYEAKTQVHLARWQNSIYRIGLGGPKAPTIVNPAAPIFPGPRVALGRFPQQRRFAQFKLRKPVFIGASGATDVIAFATTGTSAVAFVTSGVDAIAFATTGNSAVSFVTSGRDVITFAATGVSTVSFATSGVDAVTVATTGKSTAAFATSGVDALTVATTGKSTLVFTLAGMTDPFSLATRGVSTPVFGVTKAGAVPTQENDHDQWAIIYHHGH